MPARGLIARLYGCPATHMRYPVTSCEGMPGYSHTMDQSPCRLGCPKCKQKLGSWRCLIPPFVSPSQLPSCPNYPPFTSPSEPPFSFPKHSSCFSSTLHHHHDSTTSTLHHHHALPLTCPPPPSAAPCTTTMPLSGPSPTSD